MEEKFKDLSPRKLLSRYKRLIRNAPSVTYSFDSELDDYYDKCVELEEEILKRIS